MRLTIEQKIKILKEAIGIQKPDQGMCTTIWYAWEAQRFKFNSFPSPPDVVNLLTFGITKKKYLNKEEAKKVSKLSSPSFWYERFNTKTNDLRKTHLRAALKELKAKV